MKKLISVLIFIGCWSCADPLVEAVDCSTLRLQLANKTNPTTCSPPNGEIQVTVRGGIKPYHFRVNNSSEQTDSSFFSLSGGTYSITVGDAALCEQMIEVSLSNFNSDLSGRAEVSEDTDCFSGNGSVTISPLGGQPPYQLKFENSTVDNSFSILNLENGLHEVTIIDDQQCEFVLAVNIPKGKTNASWLADIKPIIDTSCAKATCHVVGTGRADLSKFENVKQLAAEIKTRTQNKSMPFNEPLPAEQIQLITCWVDDGALKN